MPRRTPNKRLGDLLTTRELARLFKVSRIAVNNWRNKGCPCVLIPGDARDTPRYVVADVVAWRESLGRKIPAGVRRSVAAKGSRRPPG